MAEESGLFQSLSPSPLAILNRLLACFQPTKPAFCANCRAHREAGPPSRHPQRNAFADCNSLYEQITDKIVAELEQGRGP